MVEIKALIGQVASGAVLSREMAYEAFDSMMSASIARLPLEDRELLHLYFDENMRQTDIAEMMGCSQPFCSASAAFSSVLTVPITRAPRECAICAAARS